MNAAEKKPEERGLTPAEVARQFLEILDGNTADLYAGKTTFESFVSMQRIVWSTVEKQPAGVKAAMLAVLGPRAPRWR